MTSTSNSALVIRFIRDVMNKGDIRLIGDLVAADHVLHRLQGDPYGPEGVRIAVLQYRTGFPDLEVEIDEIMSEGDLVARRFLFRGTHTGPFLGLPGCGRSIEVQGLGINRFREGRLIESWVSLDALGMVRQMGWAAQKQPHDVTAPGASPS